MGYYCNSCKTPIDNKVAVYSKKHFETYLCRQHQPTPYAWALIEFLNEQGINVNFEESDGHKVVDILLEDYKLVIEVDGGYHNSSAQKRIDKLRTFHSKKEGYKTIHIRNKDLQSEEDIEEYYNNFLEPFLDEREEELEN